MFPRDNKAFAFFAKQLSCQSWLAEATDKVNTIQVNRVIEKVKSMLRGEGTVAVLGLSYKPNTEIVEASQSLEIAKNLSGLGYEVKVYDPQAMNEAKIMHALAFVLMIVCAQNALYFEKKMNICLVDIRSHSSFTMSVMPLRTFHFGSKPNKVRAFEMSYTKIG